MAKDPLDTWITLRLPPNEIELLVDILAMYSLNGTISGEEYRKRYYAEKRKVLRSEGLRNDSPK